jgi:early secretory antigenic target protein ESAT-6
MGDFKVNFAALETAASDISAAGRQLQSRLDELDRSLQPLQSDWTGAASESYQQARAKWTQAIGDMNNLLTEVGRAVTQSGSGYTDAERNNAGRW